MKKYAFTLAELMMAMIFIMVIVGALISNFKPATQNSKIKIYATIRNLEKAIIAVDDRYKNDAVVNCTQKTDSACSAVQYQKTIFYPHPLNEGKNDGTFCKQMADAMNLKSSNCTASATGKTANLVFTNGVEVYGLMSTPQEMGKTTEEGKKYSYMDIGVDIDGPKGLNRLGVDRFPLRIFAVDNLVLPVDCTATQLYDWRQDGMNGNTTGLVNISAHPYCYPKDGFGTSTGTKSNINFQDNDELITYDTYLNEVNEDGSNKKQYDDIVAYSLPFRATVCGNFNRTVSNYNESGVAKKMNKFFNAAQCGTNAIFPKCNTNDKNVVCYYIMHRPASGLSALVQGILGNDLDME